MKIKSTLITLLSLICISILLASCAPAGAKKSRTTSSAPDTFDIAVYGATPGGIAAAIAAAREGAKVALVEPTGHIGGMTTSGLGNADIGTAGTVGGISKEFFRNVGKKYGTGKPTYKFEAKVAKKVFNEMLDKAGVFVFLNQPIKSASKSGGKITSFKTSKRTFTAKQFIDGSYEGDLMDAANITWTYGREGKHKYGERLAGFQPSPHRHQFDRPVSAYRKDGSVMRGVSAKPWPKIGTGDKKSMAYNFRVCMTKDKSNQIPITKPKGYDPKDYELLSRYISMSPGIKLDRFLNFFALPNKKYDVNNKGPFSSDYIGGNYKYPTADERGRQKIWNEHKRYTEGLLYFLGNNKKVWRRLKQEMNSWGYCKDEFKEHGNWPPVLYVRAARRMLGKYVLREKDLTNKRSKKTSIGMASMPIESHHIQRVIDDKGIVVNEGGVVERIKPYKIPYYSLVPKKKEATNFINPVTISASHVAYSSVRMEPVYMLLGHSAGVAAVQAINSDKAVQDVDINALQQRLRSQGQVL